MSRSDLAAFAVVLGLSALLLCPAAGFAQQMPQGGPPPQAGGAPRGPGQGNSREARLPKVRLDDIKKASRTMFATADLDRDGTVTLEELQAIMDRRRDALLAERFARLDSDGNRVIDYTEFVTWQHSLGARATGEFGSRAFEMDRVPDAVEIPAGRGDKERILGMLLTPISRASVVEANVDYDAGVDLAEFIGFERRKFDAADEDANGILEEAELRRLMDGQRPDLGCVVASLPPPAYKAGEPGSEGSGRPPDCDSGPR